MFKNSLTKVKKSLNLNISSSSDDHNIKAHPTKTETKTTSKLNSKKYNYIYNQKRIQNKERKKLQNEIKIWRNNYSI